MNVSISFWNYCKVIVGLQRVQLSEINLILINNSLYYFKVESKQISMRKRKIGQNFKVWILVA